MVSFNDEDFGQRPTAAQDVDVNRLTVEKVGPWSGDSLEALLRRRIVDLEQIEEHLRRQVDLHTPSRLAALANFAFIR